MSKTTLTDHRGTTLTTSGCGRCSSCKTIKPRDEFYRDRNRRQGISSRCKACDKVHLKKLPERSLTRDLRALMEKHPAYRPMIESMAAAVAA